MPRIRNAPVELLHKALHTTRPKVKLAIKALNSRPAVDVFQTAWTIDPTPPCPVYPTNSRGQRLGPNVEWFFG